MLGGLTYLNTLDVKNSKNLLTKIKATGNRKFALAIDVACGIGRVTEEVLCKFYAKVDLLEQNQIFLERAKEVHLVESWA
jgi:protein N-terminal methyltransferase